MPNSRAVSGNWFATHLAPLQLIMAPAAHVVKRDGFDALADLAVLVMSEAPGVLVRRGALLGAALAGAHSVRHDWS